MKKPIDKAIDFLVYSSWKAQIDIHNMSFKSARKLFLEAEKFEKIYLSKNNRIEK